MDIHYIIDAIKDHKIKITDHADEEAQADNLLMKKYMILLYREK